ncbi:MAG: hypothetical protein ACR2NK_17535, partial [Mariniblastus sp.]
LSLNHAVEPRSKRTAGAAAYAPAASEGLESIISLKRRNCVIRSGLFAPDYSPPQQGHSNPVSLTA